MKDATGKPSPRRHWAKSEMSALDKFDRLTLLAHRYVLRQRRAAKAAGKEGK